jgi:hypothetical protein
LNVPTSKRAARAVLREILENQIAANDPPEVEDALTRLRREGVAEEAAWRLMSAVLLLELDTIIREQREFDRTQYVTNLRALPALPRELASPGSRDSEAGA